MDYDKFCSKNGKKCWVKKLTGNIYLNLIQFYETLKFYRVSILWAIIGKYNERGFWGGKGSFIFCIQKNVLGLFWTTVKYASVWISSFFFIIS